MSSGFFAMFLPSRETGEFSRDVLEHSARGLKASQLMQWYSFIEMLEADHADEFQSIVANTLYAGFTASEFARSARYDTATVIRWAEGSTVPSSAKDRLYIKTIALQLIGRRAEKWMGSSTAIEAQRQDWRPDRERVDQTAITFDPAALQQRVMQIFESLVQTAH